MNVNKTLKRVFTNVKRYPHIFFIVAALFFGGLFIVAVPPLQTPDEATHFLRAYQIAEGKFISQNVNGVTGDYLPSSIQKTFTVLEKDGPIQFNSNKKYHHRQTKAALFDVPLNTSERQFYDISSASSYSPIAYLPQSVGIFIAKLFDSPVVVMLYIVRLCNLLFWVGVLYAAIRLFPWKKWAVAGIALLPMVVAQSASAGIDGVSVGSGVLFLAAICYLYAKNEALSLKVAAGVILLATVMVLSKQVMIALLPLLFLLRRSQFENLRKYWLFIALGVMVPLAMFAIWTLLVPEVSQSASQIQNGQNTAEQVKFVIGAPWQFAEALYYTFFFTWGDGIWTSLMGNFGWVDTPLPSMFIVAGYVGLAIYLFANYETVTLGRIMSKYRRWLLALLALGYGLLVCLAMYVLYSPLKYDIIVGIQGRYFFPVLFLLIVILLSSSIKVKKEWFIRFTIIFSVIMLTASVATIMYRYYVASL